jgi:hypothetical protein
MVTSATQHVAAILISLGGPEGLQPAADRMSALLQQHAAARDLHFETVS